MSSSTLLAKWPAEVLWCFPQDKWLFTEGYVKWSSLPCGKNDFQCPLMYKQHPYTVTHRKNTVSGRIYRKDPTVFYWDLINGSSLY